MKALLLAVLLQCADGAPPPCGRAARAAAPPPAHSVAVLYFDSRSRDSNDVYLADGITEEIISRLSGVQRLTVRSRHLVQRYRGTALSDPAAVGRALNVSYLVTGSVRRAGGRLRLNAELIRADGGAQVWGRQFDQAGDDVFAIQEAVAGEVATGIVGRLLPSETRAIAARPTANVAAYEAVLRGNFHLARRDSAGILRAVQEYESALRADPAYVDALSRVAVAYGIAAGNGTPIGIPQESVAVRSMRAASEAVQRAPQSSEAWLAMGIARIATNSARHGGATEALERAIALDPANVEAHHLLGFGYAVQGQDSLGLVHDRHALAINPLRPVTLLHLVQFALMQGRYREAQVLLDSVLRIDPDFGPARAAELPVRMLNGDSAWARQQLAAITLPQGVPLATARVAYYAMVHALDGQADPAIALLQRAVPRGLFLNYFLRMPPFDRVRGDPRFAALLREAAP